MLNLVRHGAASDLLGLLKPGDVLLLLLGGIVTAALFVYAWQQPQGNILIVRAQGKIVARTTLAHDTDYVVRGKLGLSRIEVRHGRVRVQADPGARQICVKRDWVSRVGDTVLCLANEVSLEIQGLDRAGSVRLYDSINY